jgi:hypothetical protein
MSGSLVAVIVIPIVVGVVLACWIIAVYHANRHPDSGPGKMPRREVIGGAFRAGGGRQVMPRRDDPVDAAGAGAAGAQAPAAEAVSSADQEPAGAPTAREADRQARREAGRPAGL